MTLVTYTRKKTSILFSLLQDQPVVGDEVDDLIPPIKRSPRAEVCHGVGKTLLVITHHFIIKLGRALVIFHSFLY